MNIIQAVILSVVEGITEFLPVSSTFHLIFSSKILGIEQTEFIKLFEVFIQSGAILSVFILYFRHLLKNKQLAFRVAVSFVPTAVVGLGFYRFIKAMFEAQWALAAVFMIVGILFILIEKMFEQRQVQLTKSLKDITYTDAVIIGLCQSFAVIPGVSRAGSVIGGMLLMKYKRVDAATYSFMLSIPTIFAASAYDLYKMRDVIAGNSSNMTLLAVGFIGAFVSSFFIVKWFLKFVQTNTLEFFGWYRLALGIIILLTLS